MKEKRYVSKWYDRSTRCWVVQVKDAEGNQIGDADYVHSKQEALHIELAHSVRLDQEGFEVSE